MTKLTLTSLLTAGLLLVAMTIAWVIPAPLNGEPTFVLMVTGDDSPELSRTKKDEDHQGKKSQSARKTAQQKQIDHLNTDEPPYFMHREDDIKTDRNEKSITLTGVKKQQHSNSVTTPQLPSAPVTEFTAQMNDAQTVKITHPKFTEKTSYGLLPRIADDGRHPSEIYSRSSNKGKQAVDEKLIPIAIVITDLGLSSINTEEALGKLPSAITFSYNPYTSRLDTWARKTRLTNREFLLEIPLEPFDYPDNDPGPHTLISGYPAGENLNRLRWIMTRMGGYVGLASNQGGKFLKHSSAMKPILNEIHKRGLIYFQTEQYGEDQVKALSANIGLNFLISEKQLDLNKSIDAIDRSLQELEQLAKKNGQAVASATAKPLTLQRLIKWAKNLRQRGFILVPLSHLAHKNKTEI